MSGFGKRSGGTTEQPRQPAAVPPSHAPSIQPGAQPAPYVAPIKLEGSVGNAPFPSSGLAAPMVSAPQTQGGRIMQHGGAPARPAPPPPPVETPRSEKYYETKGTVFGALIEAIDLAQLARLDADSAREEIRDIVNEI